VPENNDSRLPKSVSSKTEERSSIRVKKKSTDDDDMQMVLQPHSM
jgi:hypothetical protein